MKNYRHPGWTEEVFQSIQHWRRMYRNFYRVIKLSNNYPRILLMSIMHKVTGESFGIFDCPLCEKYYIKSCSLNCCGCPLKRMHNSCFSEHSTYQQVVKANNRDNPVVLKKAMREMIRALRRCREPFITQTQKYVKALELSCKLWIWLYQNPGKSKLDSPYWNEIKNIIGNCPLCDYTKNMYDPCNKCIGGYHNKTCFNDAFSGWHCSFGNPEFSTIRYAAYIASKIRREYEKITGDKKFRQEL